ncbi:unnamed protein product, partial [Iphiclides podalirius]
MPLTRLHIDLWAPVAFILATAVRYRSCQNDFSAPVIFVFVQSVQRQSARGQVPLRSWQEVSAAPRPCMSVMLDCLCPHQEGKGAARVRQGAQWDLINQADCTNSPADAGGGFACVLFILFIEMPKWRPIHRFPVMLTAEGSLFSG